MTREDTMIEKAALLGHGEIDALILRALVRKLLANCVLSADDDEPCCSMPRRV
jgi:hypothetical protein